MAEPRPWTVLPHGPLDRVAPELWLVDGGLPRGHMTRRMAVVRRRDGRLALHNAVPLDEAAMGLIEAWGEPAFLLVSNGFHRLDIHAFKARYPRMKVLCNAPHDARVRAKVAVDGHFDALPPDAVLRAEILDGSKVGEAAFVVQSGGQVSLLFGDTVMNLPHLPGLDGWLFRLIGSTGGARVTPLARLATVGNRPALRAHLLRLAALDGLTRLVPTHGAVVEGDAAAVLRAVAEAL